MEDINYSTYADAGWYIKTDYIQTIYKLFTSQLFPEKLTKNIIISITIKTRTILTTIITIIKLLKHDNANSNNKDINKDNNQNSNNSNNQLV